MKRSIWFALVNLLACAVLVACGGSGEHDAQATEIAAGIYATLTAQAMPPPPVITVVVTPPPPAEPSAVVVTPPPPTETAVRADAETIRLKADGSGDYPTLGEALLAAPEGASISLGPGTYRLTEAMTVAKALSLDGEHAGNTEIVSDAAEHVLQFQGEGPFSLHGITFRHEGEQPANVVVVLGGEARFNWCHFTGGVFGNEAGYGGIGLVFAGSATGWVLFNEATGNQEEGILIARNAQPVLENNVCRDNGGCGIRYDDQAAGVASNNEFSQNGLHGICVLRDAQPTLEDNTCRHNEQSGLVYFGQAGGTARSNDCSLNQQDGIAVQGQAQPALEGNDCYGNGHAGIGYYESATGVAHANRCSMDTPYGIYVAETAHPSLSQNQCRLAGAAESPSEEPAPDPQYNPDYLQGHGPLCFNQPERVIDREWQVSAGDGIVVVGDSVEITLRNKWGEDDEIYPVTARVIAPDESQSIAEATVQGSDDAVLVYPEYFDDADTDLRGVYTIIWEMGGGFIACYGFVVGGGAGW